MTHLRKKEREIKEKLAEIDKNLHYARIYVGQKAYQSASVCAKCAVQLINQVDTLTKADKKPKSQTGETK